MVTRLAGRLLPVAVPAVVTGALGLVGLDRHSLWRDEAASLVAVDRPSRDLLAMLGNVDLVHGAYYVLLHVWLLPGGGIVWARTLSVLAMAASAGLVAAVGSRLGSARVGLVAGLFFAVDPAVSYFAQEARSSALVVAAALLTTWLLVAATEHGSWRAWVGYGVTCAGLVALNELAVLVVVAQGVTVVWWSRQGSGGRRTGRRWLLAVLPAAAVAGALALGTRSQAAQVAWIPPTNATSLTLLAGMWTGPTVVATVLVTALVVLAMLPTSSPAARRVRAVALPLTLVPPALLVAASFAQPLFQVRYLVPTVAGVALLAALGVERLAGTPLLRGRRGLVALLVAVALAALVVSGAPEQRRLRTPLGRTDDVLASGRVLQRYAQPGDSVLFAPPYRRLDALVDPRPFAGLVDVSLAAGPVAADDLFGSELPLPQVEARLRASDRVWVVGRSGLALAPEEVDALAELTLLHQDFRVSRTVRVHSVDVVLFVRR